MTASCVPAVVRRLYTIVDDAFDADTATVFPGPPTAEYDGDVVTVGWSPNDTTGSNSEQAIVTTAYGKNEDFDVVIAISVYTGDEDDYLTLLDRAESHMDVIADALAADPTAGALTGTTPGWAYIASTAWTPGATENGIAVGLDLHIRGTARI